MALASWALIASFTVLAFMTSPVAADVVYGTRGYVFDWQYQLGEPVHPGVTPVPELDNYSGSSLGYFLSIQPHPVVKVLSPLSDDPVWEFLNGPHPPTHIFGGFENPGSGGDALTAIQTENLVFQASGTASSGASIGQYALDNYHPDATSPNPSFGLSDTVYNFSGVNMANPLLFPGAADFRSPASANSSAPNILSSLFTLPLIRLSEVIGAAPAGHTVIPFVSRFNSIGSPLINSEFMGIPAYETTDQLLSRGDFQALVTHYRMRGADGVVAHDGGVVGYSHGDFLDDTRDGWAFLNGIYDGGTNPLNLDTTDFESTGTAWSGVAGDTPSGKRVATLLLSNMSENPALFDMPAQFEGFNILPVDAADRTVDPADHRLLTFWLVGTQWHLLGSGAAFELPGDSNSGIGIGAGLTGTMIPIPEPASLAFMVMGGLMCLSRGRR